MIDITSMSITINCNHILKYFIIICFLGVGSLNVAQSQNNTRNLFQKEGLAIDINNILASREDFKPFSSYADSLPWKAVDDELKMRFIQKGEELLEEDWGYLTATKYRLFQTQGNRSIYQKIYFGRRKKLTSLVLAEMVERKGRFLDEIIDGIYIICEESNWVVPAHGDHLLTGGIDDYLFVDLFAAETASMMAYIHYLLGDELDKISPKIRERIRKECTTRLITPNLEHDEYWWMGIEEDERDRVLNNWTTWITSNWLTTVLLLEEDPDVRVRSVNKILLCIDNYLNTKSADGGCEEGPVYWTVATGRLLQSLDLLRMATDNQFDLYDESIIKNSSNFFANAHIAKNYFVNIGDGPYIMNRRGVGVFHLGKAQNNENLMSVAKSVTDYYEPMDEMTSGTRGDMYVSLAGIFGYDFFKSYEPKPLVKKEVWLPDLELLCARAETKQKDFFLSVLGAHNKQSHNHNDVGNYTIYANDQPAIIDVGVETYTKKTFSPERYEIWTMQSDYHNLPTVNGMMQAFGLNYKATDVVKSKNKLSMNIGTAYPKEAKIDYWNRSFEYDKRGIIITDDYRLKENGEGIILNHMTPLSIKEEKKGLIILLDKTNAEVVKVSYNPDQLLLATEEILLEDNSLKNQWGQDKLYRFRLSVQNKDQSGIIKLKIY